MSSPVAPWMPSSSSSSRARACSRVSPGSTLPPGNSHLSGWDWSGVRWPTRILPSFWRIAATTWIMSTLEHNMYPLQLIEHFQNPRNVGELGPPAITVEVSNPACGDILRLSVRFEDGRAAEVRYKVRG